MPAIRRKAPPGAARKWLVRWVRILLLRWARDWPAFSVRTLRLGAFALAAALPACESFAQPLAAQATGVQATGVQARETQATGTQKQINPEKPEGERAAQQDLDPMTENPLQTDPVAATLIDGAIAAPLSGRIGDAARGRAIVTDRRKGLCLLCHPGPFPEERFQGNLAPSLAGIGRRLSEGQLRARIGFSARLNPQSLMPSYAEPSGRTRIAPAFIGVPLLDAQGIEDIVAFLTTLQD